MIKNESTLDRGIRLVIAVIAAISVFAVGAGSVLGIILLAVAVILLGTAAAGFCPLYRLFGMSTCPMPSSRTSGAGSRSAR